MARFTLILTTGRSGSSLVAGLLERHGGWVGNIRPGDHRNPKGYFENQEIKTRMIERFGRDWLGPFPEDDAVWAKEAEQVIKRQGHKGEPWFFKTGVFYWKVWRRLNPLHVKVWRKRADILTSYHRSGFLRSIYTQPEIVEIVDRQLKEMKNIPGLDIDVDALIAGERDQIQAIIKASGLTYCPKITNDFIDEGLWNRSPSC